MKDDKEEESVEAKVKKKIEKAIEKNEPILALQWIDVYDRIPWA